MTAILNMRQIFLAVEATGLLHAHGDRIIEIAGIEMINFQPTGNNKHYYINPQRRSHEEAIKCHGITDESLLDKPLFGDIAEDFLAYCAVADIFLHNAFFDLAFLDKELELIGGPSFNAGVAQITYIVDTAKKIYPNQPNGLKVLSERLGVSFPKKAWLGAKDYVQLAADTYFKLKDLAK